VWRNRTELEEWVESAPQFRERADLERAAAVLDREPEIVQTLESLLTPRPVDTAVWSFMLSSKTHELVAEVGVARGWPPRDLPEIDEESTTPAMKRARALAQGIATRVNPHLPPAFALEADQEVLSVFHKEELVTYRSVVDLDVEEAICWTLECLQDEVAELSSVPWPYDAESGYAFHEPNAETRNDAVHFWFGSAEAPILAFDPLPLNELPSV
jgi:hypothetical protein